MLIVVTSRHHSYLLVTDTTASVSLIGAGSVVCVAEKVAEILKMLEELIGGVLVHVDDFRRFNIVNDKHGELEVDATLWSRTQVYSIDFSLICVFNKRTIKVCVSCF